MKLDAIIIGAGVAGLWTLHRLRQQGLQAILLEKTALGHGQTIASQGIIHGGIKYALQGNLSASSKNISDMPAIWHQCLQGQGEIDLSAAKILSDNYYLCSQQKFTQRITQFFAQKALNSDNLSVTQKDYPAFFQHEDFKGLLTQVSEYVLNVPTLIHALAQPLMPYIFKIRDCQLRKRPDASYEVSLHADDQPTLTLQAAKIILTAGAGNEVLLQGISTQALMQRRPLHMVMLKTPDLPQVFVHCIGLNANPLLTITAHPDAQGETVWYIGGQIAEEGVARSEQAQIRAAQQALLQQFPWLTLTQARWRTLRIDRAEGENAGKRPESIITKSISNVIAAWPTKLTFAPLLAQAICDKLPRQAAPSAALPAALNNWAKPAIAPAVWDAS